MIDIITTRFHEAYTWIVTENGKQQQQQLQQQQQQQQPNTGSYLSEQQITSIKRLNEDCQSHQHNHQQHQQQQTNHRRVSSKVKENNNVSILFIEKSNNH